MSPTLYTQMIHLIGIIAVAVLTGLGIIDVTTGLAFLTGLVGLALPSPVTGTPVVSQAALQNAISTVAKGGN